MKFMQKRLSFVLFNLCFLLFSSFSPKATAQVGSRFKKVIWVVFENTSYEAALKQPDFALATQQGALFTALTASTHPSLGNYIAMIAGSTFGIHSDNPVDLTDSHLGDLLEKSGRDWRVYAENYPGNCFTGKNSGTYVRKHNPFISFVNISKNSKRCQNIVGSDQFDLDLSGNKLPEYSMYLPNLRNDGHDTGVDFAGKYLTAKFGKLLSSPASLKDLLFVITFDESESSAPTNQVFTAIIGGSVIAGSKNNQSIDHTALLKLIEEEFSLGSLGQSDSRAPTLTGIWK